MKAKLALTVIGSVLFFQEAALAIAAQTLPYNQSTAAFITRVDSIELRTQDNGLDYTIIRGPGRYSSSITSAGVYNSLAIVYFSNVGTEVTFSGATALHTQRSKMSSFCLDSARQAMATGRSFWVDEMGSAGRLAHMSDAAGSYGAAGGAVVYVSTSATSSPSFIAQISDFVEGSDAKSADSSIPAGITLLPPQRCGIR